MFTVVCGEDTVASRAYFVELQKDYKKKDYDIVFIKSSDIEQITRYLGSSVSLFQKKSVFFVEKLNAAIGRSSQSPLMSALVEISKLKDVYLINWEEGKGARELMKITKFGVVKDFKPVDSIFKLLDSCFPTNLRTFTLLLKEVGESQSEQFIFFMLEKYIRNILLAKMNVLPSSVQSWQKRKLETQARFWSTEKLLKFYDGLYRIDVAIKTGSNPYNIIHALDILAYYYL